MVAVSTKTKRRMTMANIGTFMKALDGNLTGTIKTLRLNTKAKFVPQLRCGRHGPKRQGDIS